MPVIHLSVLQKSPSPYCLYKVMGKNTNHLIIRTMPDLSLFAEIKCKGLCRSSIAHDERVTCWINISWAADFSTARRVLTAKRPGNTCHLDLS